MSTEYADAASLTAGDLDLEGEDFTLPSGKKVRVRSLSRFEMTVARKNTEDSTLIEARLVAYALVNPKLKPEQVQGWQKVSKAGPKSDLNALVEKVGEISGVSEGADKSDVEEVRD